MTSFDLALIRMNEGTYRGYDIRYDDATGYWQGCDGSDSVTSWSYALVKALIDDRLPSRLLTETEMRTIYPTYTVRHVGRSTIQEIDPRYCPLERADEALQQFAAAWRDQSAAVLGPVCDRDG